MESNFYKKYKSEDEWTMDLSKFSTKEEIIEHAENLLFLSKSDEKSYISVLCFLYLKNYNIALSRNTVKRQIELGRLTDVERLAANKLSYRSSGTKAKHVYGMASVQAMRDANYRCCVCGLSDLRCLDIDHIQGRKKGQKDNPYTSADFQILCSNHHAIKTRMESLEDDKREKRLLKLLQTTISDRTETDNNEIERLKKDCDLHSHVSSVMKQVNDLFNELNDK